jgi:hypothetical protein
MRNNPTSGERLVMTVAVVDGFETAARRDREFWHAQDPLDRLVHLEQLRRINYGDAASSGRLRRVLEVARRSRR